MSSLNRVQLCVFRRTLKMINKKGGFAFASRMEQLIEAGKFMACAATNMIIKYKRYSGSDAMQHVHNRTYG